MNTIEHSLVVTDPVGTCVGSDRVVSMKVIGYDNADDLTLSTALRELVEKYIEVCYEAGLHCSVIAQDYIWKKRVEVMDEYGRLRAIREFEVRTCITDAGYEEASHEGY